MVALEDELQTYSDDTLIAVAQLADHLLHERGLPCVECTRQHSARSGMDLVATWEKARRLIATAGAVRCAELIFKEPPCKYVDTGEAHAIVDKLVAEGWLQLVNKGALAQHEVYVLGPKAKSGAAENEVA